jgi:ribosome-interacting GTPase 1
VKDFSTLIPHDHSMGLEDEIEDLREEIAETPYNKSTEAHIGRLKSKLAEKKEELENQSSAGGGQGYSVEQTGDATVALVGMPSAGKSTLLNALTNAESEVGSYDFTTLDVNPGMLKHKGANIQLLDVPGLIEGAAGGRGGGQEVLSVIRTADLVVFVLSVFEIDQYARLSDELHSNKVRLDTQPPKVRVTPKGMGGIDVTMAADVDLEPDTVREVLREHGHVNADVAITEPLDLDQLLDGVIDNRVYLPSLVAVNKADLIDRDYLDTVNRDLHEHGISPEEAIFISAEEEKGLDVLRERIWNQLGLIRVYMNKPGRGTDYEEPLVLHAGQTVGEACEKLGGDLEDRFRFARVSGPSAKHDDQQVGKGHELRDEDVLRIVARR